MVAWCSLYWHLKVLDKRGYNFLHKLSGDLSTLWLKCDFKLFFRLSVPDIFIIIFVARLLV